MTNDFLINVLLGKVPGAQYWHKDGLNLDVDTSEENIVMNDGTQNWMVYTGDQIEFISDSAADDGSPVGTGAHTIDAWFLDTDFNIVKESITLNGLTAVATTATDLIR